jgi:hypothetical protein
VATVTTGSASLLSRRTGPCDTLAIIAFQTGKFRIAQQSGILIAMTDLSSQDSAPLPWHHRVIVRYGPLGLIVLGLGLLATSVVTHRSDATEVGYITLGTILVLSGALIARFRGLVEVGTTGVKGSLVDINALDPYAFVSFARGSSRPQVIGVGAVEPKAAKSESSASEVLIIDKSDLEDLTGFRAWLPRGEVIKPSDITIKQLMEQAMSQGWTIEQSPNSRHARIVAPDQSRELLVPGAQSWYATRDLLRVASANGLDVIKAAD